MTYHEEHESCEEGVKVLVLLAKYWAEHPFENFKRFIVKRQLHSSRGSGFLDDVDTSGLS
jgi:hypothetical protein